MTNLNGGVRRFGFLLMEVTLKLILILIFAL